MPVWPATARCEPAHSCDRCDVIAPLSGLTFFTARVAVTKWQYNVLGQCNMLVCCSAAARTSGVAGKGAHNSVRVRRLSRPTDSDARRLSDGAGVRATLE